MVGQTQVCPISLIIIKKNGRRALCGVAFFFVRKIFLYLCVSFFVYVIYAFFLFCRILLFSSKIL